MKNLIGKQVRVISDNDCYDSFRDRILTITYADNKGLGYDNCAYPEMLCDFVDEEGNKYLALCMNTNLN
jgi:hypothetical protein